MSMSKSKAIVSAFVLLLSCAFASCQAAGNVVNSDRPDTVYDRCLKADFARQANNKVDWMESVSAGACANLHLSCDLAVPTVEAAFDIQNPHRQADTAACVDDRKSATSN